MPEFDAERFARDWIAAWSRSDVEGVLAWFVDDAIFVSPLAARVVGNAEVRGKAALRDYWQRALRLRNSPPHFELDACLWDERRRACLLVYVSREPDGSANRKSELFWLGADNLFVRAESFSGAVAQR